MNWESNVGGKGIISEGKAAAAQRVCTWDMSITIVAVICSLHLLIYSLPLSPSMSASYSGRRQMDGWERTKISTE